jgi:pimeloyl-ACP methyl ester carboxylesterase
MNYTMDVMVKVMKARNFPIDSPKKVVCVGHSAGGQFCRHYAQHLPSIKGAILLDSVVGSKFFQLFNSGLPNPQDSELVYQQRLDSISFVGSIAFLWPLSVGAFIFDSFPSQFEPL